MKKVPALFHFFFAVFLFSNNGFAQSAFLGVELGYARPELRSAPDSELAEAAPTDKYLFGATVRLEKKWAVAMTGLFYSEKGDRYLHFNSFEAPLLFGVHPLRGRLGLALYGGGYFSWWNRGMYGDDRAEKPTLLERMMSDARKTHLEEGHPLRKGRDIGLKAGVEAYFQFRNKGRLTLGFFGSRGLKDFQYSEADSSPKFRFRQYSVSLGYLMPL
ncbi:MAG: hypothetical protein H6559_15460 [Lewinellaceae bacterium]|nr:hypothetical protein [Lewinellaceae bacterium]